MRINWQRVELYRGYWFTLIDCSQNENVLSSTVDGDSITVAAAAAATVVMLRVSSCMIAQTFLTDLDACIQLDYKYSRQKHIGVEKNFKPLLGKLAQLVTHRKKQQKLSGEVGERQLRKN
jgi:hypothetical protein